MTNEQINEYSNYIYGLTKYFEGYKNKEDLYQVGCMGIIQAYNHYNPNMDAKFTTYAFKYILGEMYRYVRKDKGVKISRNITSLNLKIDKTIILLSQKLMRQPSIDEIANYLEVDKKIIEEAILANQVIQSIDIPINDEGKEITFHDVIGDETLDIDTLIALKQELSNLNKEEKQLVVGCLINNKNQEEVAKEMGISQVQVSRKLTKVKEKIKSNLIC